MRVQCLTVGSLGATSMEGMPIPRKTNSLLSIALVLAVNLTSVAGNAESDYTEAFRPQFHFTPPQNFMNDPNGLVYYKGEYHLFYQHNPFGDSWGHMSWRHAVSTDLVHWRHLPIALMEEDPIMIFSGSAVVDWKDSSGLCRNSDLAAWITEGGWNSVQDYGLGIWWEKGSNVIENAIQSGDPRPIERALRDYHDRVVAAGGALYFQPPRLEQREQEQFGFIVLACLGDLIQINYNPDLQLDPELTWILKTKASHQALQQLSLRWRLTTKADERHYAFLRTAADGSERILVALNFQPTEQNVEVDLSGVATDSLIELNTGKKYKREISFKVELPAFGYRLFLVSPAKRQM